MTYPGIITDLDGSTISEVDSDSPTRERKIIVANFLPLDCQRDEATGQWNFTWDKDSLLLQLKDGFSSETKVIYVGSLKVNIGVSEQEAVDQILRKKYKCVPTFLPPDHQNSFYHRFCKHQLWPLFHYMLPMPFSDSVIFEHALFRKYISANRVFADRVIEVIRSEDDLVWVHDYHLMLVPTFLRKHMNRIKLGFFLHSPFPSLEIFRTLPVREHILMGLLNSDLIGFHTFDYARHFLACCRRLLGMTYECKRGYIELNYYGRMVRLKILPVGIHVGHLQSLLKFPSTIAKVQEIEEKYKGKKLILGVDDMDIFKGISLKFLGLELLLERNPKLRGEVVLVQIVNPARSTGKDIDEARKEALLIAERIKLVYGGPDYDPVVLIDYYIPFYHRVAFYAAAQCCIVNAVRDGMNLVPYEYTICRQGTEEMDRERGIRAGSPHTSSLIVSEFVGCSPSLSGAFKVNPWSVDQVADALCCALFMEEYERQLHHDKHFRYVSSHDVAYWARSFVQDFERACVGHSKMRCYPMGFGLSFRVIALSPGFQRLSLELIVPAFYRTSRRAIFLDYDGTIVPDSLYFRTPSKKVISILNSLCSDSKNTVFIVSGRGRNSLDHWLSPCDSLGIVAEHGYFIRQNKFSDWKTSDVNSGHDWKEIVEPIMKVYTEITDGSYIEYKESALVWHHQDTPFDFGSSQAKELLDHLDKVLFNEAVVIRKGQNIVEVEPRGISKGKAVEQLLREMIKCGKPPDVVMCIGDDGSDEDMFESINNMICKKDFPSPPEVFTCTVGQNPSKAKYYVDDTDQVISLLECLTSVMSETLNPSDDDQVPSTTLVVSD